MGLKTSPIDNEAERVAASKTPKESQLAIKQLNRQAILEINSIESIWVEIPIVDYDDIGASTRQPSDSVYPAAVALNISTLYGIGRGDQATRKNCLAEAADAPPLGDVEFESALNERCAVITKR